VSALQQLFAGALVAIASGFAGLAAGEHGVTLQGLRTAMEARIAVVFGDGQGVGPVPQTSGPIIYWRHPDGLPQWSAERMQTSDGRSYVPVGAKEDVSFDPPVTKQTEGERRILHYRNPMGLPDISPTPKKDSMGMDYIPVYEGEGSDDGSVTVSPGKLQRTGVRTAKAVRAPLSAVVRAPGIVALDENLVSVIALRADAFVEKVADVTSGSVIAAGAPLVTLYSPEIAQAGAQFVVDIKNSGGGDTGRQRLRNLGVPEEVIEDLARNGTATVTIPLSAPRSGVVLERMAVEGMMAKAGEPLFRIADMSSVWVIAEIPQSALMEVSEGDGVKVSLPGRSGPALLGSVDTIYPEISMTTRTGRLRITLPNPDGQLRANMFADVEIMLGQTPVVQVPEGAVIDTGERQVVILDLGSGRFKPQPVTVGRRGGGKVEIVAGVSEGDIVVSAATFLIDAESNLNAALAALAAPEQGQ
jgi:Cu(I)/Ag(I) efflux system membrane fusion protein